MSQCSHCGGLIAEPGKAYSYSGKFCMCHWDNGQLKHGPRFGTPYDSTSVEEFQERQAKELRERIKGNVQKPSISHIINLCEQLPKAELGALVNLLRELHARD